MLSQFQASYQRVEASLQRLTDSIAAYNPSTTAADELYDADAAVKTDVDQLVKHQKNHVRLEELRRTTDALDEQIKSTIRLLADTRKDIQSIPSSDTSESRREVSVDELLSYAKFIAPTTVPPTFRKAEPLVEPTKDKPAERQNANGMPTPPQGTSQDPESGLKEESRAVKELEPAHRDWLKPKTLPFDPWPSPEAMKHGALGKIQKMLEDGIDPASVLSPEEQAAADRKRRDDEERQRKEEEEKQRRAREEWGYGAPTRRQTVVDEPFNPDDL